MPTFLAAKIPGQLSVIVLYGALCLCFRLSSVGFLFPSKLIRAALGLSGVWRMPTSAGLIKCTASLIGVL